MFFFLQGTPERVRNSRGKRTINVRATEVLLYVEFKKYILHVKLTVFYTVSFTCNIHFLNPTYLIFNQFKVRSLCVSFAAGYSLSVYCNIRSQKSNFEHNSILKKTNNNNHHKVLP